MPEDEPSIAVCEVHMYDPNGEVVTDDQELLPGIYAYYAHLFVSPESVRLIDRNPAIGIQIATVARSMGIENQLSNLFVQVELQSLKSKISTEIPLGTITILNTGTYIEHTIFWTGFDAMTNHLAARATRHIRVRD